MNFEDFPEAKPVFDEPAVKTVLAETGLPLAPGTTVEEIRESLEDIARQHYWNEFNPPDPKGESEVIRLDAIADTSVAPSRLRNRLIAIEQSSKRVFGTICVERSLRGRPDSRQVGGPCAHRRSRNKRF